MRTFPMLVLPFASLVACTEPQTRPGKDTTDDDTTPPTADTDDSTADTDTTPEDTSESVDTSDTDTGTPIPTGADCANLPAQPLAKVELGPHRGYHGLAFDTDGFLIGSDGDSLVKADAYGAFAVHAPNTGALQQMDWLPDGDLVVADSFTAAVIRIDAAGVKSPIAQDLGNLYGLRVGPDGMIYTANQDVIHRIDPATGQAEVLIDPGPGVTPKVLDWSPDYTRMYFGTTDGDGEIYVVDIDVPTMDPITPPMPFATGTGGWHDCLDVDECGNLYVCDFNDSALYRVSPLGQVSKFVEWETGGSGNYGHGLEWGSGTHGWSDTSIFQPQPYDGDTVVMLDIGVRSRYAVAPAWP